MRNNAYHYGDKKMRDVVKVFKALSDETRLRILGVLMQRECCVCEIMQALEISQTRASRNLGALYDAGLLKLRRDGCWALYSIDEDAIQGYTVEVLAAVRKALKGNQIAAQDNARLASARRIGTGCEAAKAS